MEQSFIHNERIEPLALNSSIYISSPFPTFERLDRLILPSLYKNPDQDATRILIGSMKESFFHL